MVKVERLKVLNDALLPEILFVEIVDAYIELVEIFPELAMEILEIVEKFPVLVKKLVVLRVSMPAVPIWN